MSNLFQDVYDRVEYLSSLGKSQTAAVKRDADIGVAQANRDAGIRVSLSSLLPPSSHIHTVRSLLRNILHKSLIVHNVFSCIATFTNYEIVNNIYFIVKIDMHSS